MGLLRLTVPGEVRDFAAERRKLLTMTPSPDTDRLQDLWESDPEVVAWYATLDSSALEGNQVGLLPMRSL